MTRGAMARHSQSIGFFLNSMKELEAISVQVARLAAAQQALSALLPKHLAGQIQVVSEDRGALLLSAPNSAVAAKLRHLAPRILAGLAQQNFRVQAVRVTVQMVRRTRPVGAPKRRMTATATSWFRELSQSVSHPPLRRALQQLAREEPVSDRQDPALEREQGKDD